MQALRRGSGRRGFTSRLAAMTVSIGAIGLMLLAFVAGPVGADTPVDSGQLRHLESLLAEHNVRYAMQMHGDDCSGCDCTDNEAERG